MPTLQNVAWLLILFTWQQSHAQPGKPTPLTGDTGIKVVVFLSPECPLCQNYTRTLNQLGKQYAGKITVIGIIPGKTWKPADLTGFASKYQIAFRLTQDADLSLTRRLHATTTPEALLLAADNTILYQGAIDNWYKALGRAGNRPTQNYLQDAIELTLRHEALPVKKTTPIGCLINDF
jgi:thiol-disulfide isomerase/thioredoxin